MIDQVSTLIGPVSIFVSGHNRRNHRGTRAADGRYGINYMYLMKQLCHYKQ